MVCCSAGRVRAQVVLLLHGLVLHVQRPRGHRGYGLVAYPLHQQLRVVRHQGGGRRVLVEHADGAVLPDAVRHLGRVDPHRQLRREQPVEEGPRQAHGVASLGDDGVHGAVDPEAPVGRASVRPVGEPVVPVPVGQQITQRALEHLQLGLAQAVVVQPQQLDQEVHGRMDLQPHDVGGQHSLAHSQEHCFHHATRRYAMQCGTLRWVQQADFLASRLLLA